MRDAGPRRGPSELARQEQIADFALAIVELDAFVLWSAVNGQLDAVWHGRDDIDGRGAGPGDADTAFGGRGSRFHEDGLEESIQQMRSEAIGAHLELVAVGVCAAFGREHDLLCRAFVSEDASAKARIWRLALTYTGIAHQYVEPLLSCEEGLDAGLNGR